MKPRPIDLTGVSIEAAMEIAARDFLHICTAALVHIARELSRDGADRDKINALLELELELERVAAA